jgi:hypothetical protein
MLRRLSLRSTVTTLAAATVLVGGADLASYAATGNPLILGHGNTAGTTTALKNTGRGPALSLNSAKSAPPLLVNSSKLVKHLNADTVHGVSVAVVAPKNYQIPLAKAGGHFSGAKVVTASLPPATYQITLQGVVIPDTTTSVQCFVGDKRFLTAPTPDVNKIWAVDSDPNGTTFGVSINAVGAAAVKKHVKVFVACIASSGANQVLLPIAANFTQVNGLVKRPTKPLTLRNGSHRGFLAR